MCFQGEISSTINIQTDSFSISFYYPAFLPLRSSNSCARPSDCKRRINNDLNGDDINGPISRCYKKWEIFENFLAVLTVSLLGLSFFFSWVVLQTTTFSFGQPIPMHIPGGCSKKIFFPQMNYYSRFLISLFSFLVLYVYLLVVKKLRHSSNHYFHYFHFLSRFQSVTVAIFVMMSFSHSTLLLSARPHPTMPSNGKKRNGGI